MKKKLISLLLVSAMAAATAGCGSSVPANSVECEGTRHDGC